MPLIIDEQGLSIKRYNVAVLDECVGNRLSEDLLEREIACIIIDISRRPEMKGMRDDYVLEFCYYYGAALVTNDKRMFERYHGYKIYKWSIGDKDVINRLVKHFEKKRSSLSINDYISINENLLFP